MRKDGNNMINPIELKTFNINRRKIYEIHYKNNVIFSSTSVKELTNFAQKKIDEGYYLRYVPKI